MGKESRRRPKKLAFKLRTIRNALGDLTQDEIAAKLDVPKVERSNISQYERGVREPSYITILAYAKLAGVCTDYLIDDALELPEILPSNQKHPLD